MEELTRLIREDMKPALGVTEPGAIAFAAARAKAETEGEVLRVDVALNSGMYKNAYTCGIPGSDAYGNLQAAALGVVAADPAKGLESLDGITDADNEAAAKMVRDGRVHVALDHMGSEITIDATVCTETDTCSVHIRGTHTHIQWIDRAAGRIRGSRDTGHSPLYSATDSGIRETGAGEGDQLHQRSIFHEYRASGRRNPF